MSQFTKNNNTFYNTNCHKAFKNIGLGSGIQDPGSGKKPIPDPRAKKAPDPGSGSGSATLTNSNNNSSCEDCFQS